MGILQHGAAIPVGDTGYNIDHSLKLETTNNEWLYRASPTAGNRKTHTFSFWIKRSTLGNPTASGTMYVIGQGQHGRMFFSSDYFQYRFDDGHDVRDVTIKHRDPAAWLHVVVSVDTNQVSSSNRVKIFFNGVQSTVLDFDGGSYPDIQDSASGWFTTNYLTIGTAPFGGSYNAGDGDYDMSGYLAEFVAIDGTAYAPTDFGEYDDDSGIWKPKDVSELTFGSEGFYLNFSNASNLGEDFSGNDNDFASSNLSAADQATDTPTNNFAIANPLIGLGGFSVPTEGGTKAVLGVAGPGNNTGGVSTLSTIAVSKGKWYMEMKNDVASDSVDTYARFGFVDVGDLNDGGVDGKVIARPGSAGGAYFGGTGGGRYHYNNTAQGNSTTWIRQIMGMALDLDNRKAYFHIDGTYTNSGDPANGTDNGGQYDMNTGGDGIYVDETWVLGASAYNLGIFLMNWGGYTVMPISSAASDANGYGTFEYAPPSGYYALCSKNVAKYG
jgi:hypothetical protein